MYLGNANKICVKIKCYGLHNFGERFVPLMYYALLNSVPTHGLRGWGSAKEKGDAQIQETYQKFIRA